jgi:hypothetical protein
MGNNISDSLLRNHRLLTRAKARRNSFACALLLIASMFAETQTQREQRENLAGTSGEFYNTQVGSHKGAVNGAANDIPQPEPTQTTVYRYPGATPSMCGLGSMASGGDASEARAHLLDKDGPQLPPVFSMSSFSVMGFVKGNWPVVFDYQLERDSLLIVVIAPEGQEPIIYRLNGKAGHWQNRLSVPAAVGTNSVVAEYTLQSLDDGLGQLGPAHLHVHGVAAGPKAVGSIGIDQVTFSPAEIHPAHGERAHYMFHSISDFKNVEVNFVRIANDHGQIIAARIGKKSAGSIAKNEAKNGDWDGKSDGGGKDAQAYPPELQQWLRSPTGQHLVQVRAWYGAKDGDWATALSEQFVTVE